MTETVHPPENSVQPSQFVGGFVMGLVLGTAGYYFLGTTEGKRLRQKLVTRWHKLAETAVADKAHSKVDWSDRLRSGLRLVAKELGVNGKLTATAKPGQTLPKTRTTNASASVLTPQRVKTKSGRVRAKFKGV